jgi:hypothetical protein
MRQETTSPIVLAQARTTEGAAFQLRGDSKGVLEVSGLANVLISHTSGFARCAAPGRSEPLFPEEMPDLIAEEAEMLWNVRR